MRSKTKIRVKVKTVEDQSKSAQKRREAVLESERFRDQKDDSRMVRQAYIKHFGNPPSNASTTMMALRVEYHLFKESTPPEAWAEKSKSVLQNYAASQAMNFSGLSELLRSLVECNIKEEQMNKTTKSKMAAVAAKNGKGIIGKKIQGKKLSLGIQETWVHLFSGKEGRLTDEQISSFLKKEFPGRKTTMFEIKNVSAVRSKYNGGGLTHGDKPKHIEQYNPNGDKKKLSSADKPKKSSGFKVKVK